jgi:hypothetical protein
MTNEELEHLRRLAQAHQAQQAQHFHQHLANEEQKLLDKVPAWKKDPEMARKEIGDIKRYLIDHHGYSEQDLAVIPDHRNLLAARKLYMDHQRETEAKRRAADEKTKRERQRKAEADKAAEKGRRLDEAKKTVRRHPLSSYHGAQALADAIDDE